MELNIVKTIQGLSTPFWDVVMNIITLGGSAFFLAFVFFIFYYMFDKRYAMNFLLASTGVSLFNYGIKSWIKRPRPYIESMAIAQKSYSSNYSFASGHSTAISSIASGVIINQRHNKKHLWWICLVSVICCLLVGFSRIYLGHHFLTDVITGLFLGGFITTFVILFLNKYNLQKWVSLILGIAGFLGLFIVIPEWFIVSTRINTFRACGGVCGLGIGAFMEFMLIDFKIQDVKNRKHIWWVTAIAIFEVALLFFLFNLLPQYGMITFMSLFIVGFFSTFVQMLIMKKIYNKLDQKWK